MGFDDPQIGAWTPLYDYTLIPDERAEAFGKWLTFHFPHPDLVSRDPARLISRMDIPVKTRSFTNTPTEQFLTMVDFTANSRGEHAMGEVFYRELI